MFKKLIGLAFAVSLLAGCVVGQKVDHSGTGAYLAATPVKADTVIALGVQDLRPAVLSGEKAPTFVGKMRSGWGIPYDVSTTSGAPLAQDVQALFNNSLTRGGAKITSVTLTPKMTAAEVKAALAATKADRIVYVSLQQWHSDSMIDTNIVYDFTLHVADSTGTDLATKQQAAHETSKGDIMSNEGSIVAGVFQRAVETSLRDEKIRAALQ